MSDVKQDNIKPNMIAELMIEAICNNLNDAMEAGITPKECLEGLASIVATALDIFKPADTRQDKLTKFRMMLEASILAQEKLKQVKSLERLSTH